MNIYTEIHLLRFIQTTIHSLMSSQQLNWMLVDRDGLQSWPITISLFNIGLVRAMLKQMLLAGYHGQKFLMVLTLLIWENMDTHIVNAIIAGARSKSSLIESISSSPEIIPSELITDSSEPPLDWFKLQRADPSLATIIHLMESDQLYKRKPYKKDSADVKSLLRIKKMSSFD